MAPRYPTNPNRVTLDFDPITSDALTQAAKVAKVDRQRLAYQLVQEGLGIGVTIAPAALPAAPDYDDPVMRTYRRGIADLNRLQNNNKS